MRDGRPVLWQYSFSNFNEKVRWALDFKGIPHRRRSLHAGRASCDDILPRRRDAARARPRREAGRRLHGDHRCTGGSVSPSPPSIQQIAEERRSALELEEYFDEHAGHDMRRVGFWEARQHLGYAVDFMTTDQPNVKRVSAGSGCASRFPACGGT